MRQRDMDLRDRFLGCLTGLAVGDALGTTLEFTRPGGFEPINDMVGGGPFNLEPGQWTDDTSMALCLADSLLARDGFDPTDQMHRYVRWWRQGYRSSRPGDCFDIGNTVRRALVQFERTGEPFAGSTDAQSAGNGSLMRLAPVVMFYATDVEEAVARATDSSRTTHGAAEAVDACRYLAVLLVAALEGRSKSEMLFDGMDLLRKASDAPPLTPAVRAIAEGAFARKAPQEIRASGYVVHTLEAAVWAFHASSNFKEGALLAVNLGEDADTTGAVYGQLAGAHYGLQAIPPEWRDRLYDAESIIDVATRLHNRAARERASASKPAGPHGDSKSTSEEGG
jgi:ADP-ribosylglycohydrolase